MKGIESNPDLAPREGSLRDGAVFRPYQRFRTFILIPHGLASHKGFTPGAKLVYGILSKYAGKDGSCFPSMKTIGQDLGMTERWASKLVGELEKGGLLHKTRGGKGRANRYNFVWRDWLDQPNRKDDSDQGDSPNDADQKDPSGVDRNDSSGPYGTILPTKRFKKKTHMNEKDLDSPLRGPEFPTSGNTVESLRKLVSEMIGRSELISYL